MILNRGHILFWCITSLITFVFLCAFQEITFPFIMGILLAYILAPLVNKMQNVFSRTISSIFITITFISFFIFLAIFLLPKIEYELINLAHNVPEYVSHMIDLINSILSKFNNEELNLNLMKSELQKYVSNNLDVILRVFIKVIPNGNTITSFFSYIIIIPVTMFYMLKDWNKLNESISKIIPIRNRYMVEKISQMIRLCFAKYFKGQSCIAAILSFYYSVALLSLGINKALLLGVVSGILSFIPFIGAIFCCILAVFLGVSAGFSVIKLSFVLIIYLIGQFSEGYLLAPRFIGSEVGLHPLWILFSFFAGMQIYGILGVVLAIPCAAMISTVVKFSIYHFRKSSYFKS